MEKTIGQLAKAAKVNVETIRYYERRGLLEQPRKPMGGFRHYPPEALNKLRFIKRAQELGFSLDEVQTLLEIDAGQCEEVQDLASQKLSTIKAKISDLQRLENSLGDLLTRCQSAGDDQSCPLIDSLLDTDNTP